MTTKITVKSRIIFWILQAPVKLAQSPLLESLLAPRPEVLSVQVGAGRLERLASSLTETQQRVVLKLKCLTALVLLVTSQSQGLLLLPPLFLFWGKGAARPRHFPQPGQTPGWASLPSQCTGYHQTSYTSYFSKYFLSPSPPALRVW